MVKYLLPFLFFLSCASTDPHPKWYGLQLPSYEHGSLLGPTEKDDLPIKTCEPDEYQKGKCVVLLIKDFERILTDYHKAIIQLRHYEKSCE